VELIAAALGRLEVQLREDTLHGDLVAKSVEVDSWHGLFSFVVLSSI
jgi:hypothetical protein